MVEQVKNKKSHSGLGAWFGDEDRDMFGLRLLNKKHLSLQNVILVSNTYSIFLI
jgi:hypothetical protein